MLTLNGVGAVQGCSCKPMGAPLVPLEWMHQSAGMGKTGTGLTAHASPSCWCRRKG